MSALSRSTRQISKLLLLLISLVFTGGAFQQAHATLYWANSSQVQLAGMSDATAAEAKFRLSYTNWDQSLSNSAGTTISSNGNTFLSNNLVGYGISSLATPTQFGFSFSHIVDKGFVFTMTNLANPAQTSTLEWGSGFSPLSGAVISQATLPTNSSPGLAPTGSFNSLMIYTVDSRNKPGTAMSFSNLAFTGADSGGNALTLADGALLPSGTATISTGTLMQSIVANSDLSTINWSLTGVLAGSRDNAASSDESVKFYVDAVQNNFTLAGGALVAAPEPGSIAVLAGLIVLSCGSSVASRMRRAKNRASC